MNKRYPRYPDDADYQTNAPSYYEDLARKQKLIEMLSKRIWEYENTLNETLEQIEQRLTDYIQQNDLLMNERLENWDQRIDEMPEEMRSLFVTWLEDGTLEQIINHDVLGKKADKDYVDDLNENVTAQLADETKENRRNKFLINSFNKQLYNKKVILNLPGRFPDYYDVMSGHTEYIHAQVFSVLKEENLLFILYMPDYRSTMKNRWIAIYNWENGEYISCFGVPSYGVEGLVVKKEGDKTYLYISGRSKKYQYDLHKYDITVLPNNKEVLSEYEVIELSIGQQFGYNNGKWLVQKEDIYTDVTSSYWQVLDDDFNVIKNIRLDGTMRSLVNPNTLKDFPKVQSIGIGSNFFVCGVGASASLGVPYNKNLQQGILIIDSEGNLTKEGILNHRKFGEKLNTIGYNVEKVENEGIWIDTNDDIYSLCVLNSTDSEKGIVIFKEITDDNDSIDFNKQSDLLFSLDIDRYSERYFPNHNGYFYNPITQTKFTKISEILDFALKYNLSSVNVYISNDVKLLDANGEERSGVLYKMINTNGYTMIGVEQSTTGIRNLWYNGSFIKHQSSDRTKLYGGSFEVKKGNKIKLSKPLNEFKKIEFIYTFKSYNNKVFTFDTETRSFEIRDFNMADTISNETIMFIEVLMKFNELENEIEITKAINQVFNGLDTSRKEELDDGGSIKAIYGLN